MLSVICGGWIFANFSAIRLKLLQKFDVGKGDEVNVRQWIEPTSSDGTLVYPENIGQFRISM